MQIVPTSSSWSGSGSSESVFCSTSSSIRSVVSAVFTDSTEAGRFTASGCSVSGKATVRRRGSTGSDEGRGAGVWGSAMDGSPEVRRCLSRSYAPETFGDNI